MSESTLKPFTGKLDENIDTNQQPALKPFTGALDGEKKGVMGHLKDTGLSALKGAVAVPELAVGIMDVMSDGATGKILENKNGTVGFRPKEAKQALGDLHTDQYKAQQQEFADAGKDGNWVDKVVDKTKVALTNPSLIANTVVESVPSMLAGGVLGRASGIANPVVAGAVGEGAVMAGSQAEQIRQETVDGRLTADQSLAGVTTGVLGGLIGFAGGRLAQKMGIGDVDTMLVTGRAGPADIAGEIASMPAKSLPRRVIEGAISEGFLEELPQSVSEQVIQNLALDKPWHDGIEDAAVMGTLAGMAMGGAANILPSHNTGTESQDNQQQSGSPNLPSAPPQSGSNPNSAMTGEYIPRGNAPQGDNQGRTAFVYDQPSMEADNLLNNNGFDQGNAAAGNPTAPGTPPAPKGNDFDDGYGSEAAFDDLLNAVPPASKTPSQQMGINPNDGPMSSAAALAVDSGASPIAQLGYTPEQQTQEQSNTPISDVVPNDYRQLLGNHNEGQSFNTNFEDAAIQQGNAQSDNAGESISQQYDINTADEMAGEFEKNGTESAPQTKTTQPILGQDGKNKWFGSQEKAQAFLDKKNLGNDYQVVQDGKRFEIQPNVAQVQDGNQSQLKALEQQFEEAKTVPEKARIRKEINALQQGDNQPSAIENTISASENNISMPKNTILDAQNNIDKTQTNNVADQLAQLEQQFLDAKSVPQKAKLKKQIDQLKSQQTEMTTTPFSSEQIQKQYGDTAESVMSDIEILGDDFTIDLRDDNKKTNALNNPNYNAVQKADGSVEIVGMKHPSTGEWVGKKPNAISIDENAHQAATSSQNNTPEPTQAQIEAGNYKKGHIKVHGLDISIENPKGSERRGTDPNGKEWAHTMSDHYGYIKRTKGADQEHIDTYVGKNPESENVFIVDQIDQGSGGFDEHKVMLGFDSQEEATTAYQSNFDKGWKVGPIRTMNMEQFKDWLKNEDTSKPATSTDANKPKEAIKDLGEKIGGARKDTALSTGKSKKTKSTDNRPTWAKRYTISEIVSSTNSNETGKWVIEDSKKTDWKGSPKKLGMFDSEQEAKDMLPVVAVGLKHRVYARRDGESGFEIWRQINDVKRVKVVNKVFDTKQDAQTYLIENANNILETSTTFGELDLPRPENTVRKGIERRKGDAKDTDFMKVFGFRGVEFGNWNNQEERQQLLNDAYDGLLDLAEVLKIPAKAISLNGDLALAFGARGQGLSSARAHYEPAKVVINLTKMNGAGSLAHEWWHAFDHYLARQDGIASAEWVVDADGTRSLKISNSSKDRMVSHGFSYRNSGVREDVRDAYTDLMKTMSTKAEQYVEDVQAVDKFVGQSRDRVKERLDSLREDLSRQRDPKYYKRHNKPASAEQLVVFDTISQKLINGELLETEWRADVKNKSASGIFSGARWINDALEQLGEIYKSVRGRSGFSKDQDAVLDRLRSAMNSYANRLKMLADAQKEVSKTRKIPTKFVMDAKNLDEGRGSDYWTTPHELSARAFQGFVEDKVTENNGRSPFLNHAPENTAIETPWGWMRPYPHGDERKAINAKFSDLVDTLKTEETETGIKLYSRDKLKPDNERRGASPLDTTFTPLSVVSATRRVLSILQHLKMSATQDASSRGRINVSLNNRIGVDKVGNVNSNGFSVQVISSFSDLPKVIQNDATYKDENGKTQNYDVRGVWHDGTLYVVADQVYGDSNKQLTTFDAYEELLTHEIVGHFGVQKLFGNEYKTKFQQLFNALGKLEGIRKIAKDNGVDMQQFESAYIEPYTQGAKEGIYAESDVQQALVGELFAFVAQNAKSRPFVRQKLKEVIGYIRQWFRDRGFDKFLSRYNDADLMMFLSEARKAVVDRSYFGKYKNQEFSSKNNSDTPLYSRRTKSNSGSTTQQVRDVLIDRFGKETIDELERQGKLEIIQDYQVEGVEGFYYNGKAVLVASNLTAESTVPTFLHELGGHAGFQNMMTQKQYNELMNQFNKLVDQGNPIAMAAKMLAEREQGSERQQLEYLPYLLTLSSTMQQRNVIQRNALQKLINNIVSYVKAWVFDNFGINLNLNPDDMLALSERMIGQIKHQSSLDLIRQKYHGTNQWMTAPNGAKTHLSEQQWLQVRTPEFKKWFGDWENDAANASQVLDENGEPKVVYHGTATEFNEFKQGHGLLGDGIYLTDSFDTADVYANIRGENGFVLPLFVNIRNVFKTTGNVSRDEFVEATTSGKYQGIVHQFENHEYIVALEPNQVKMAEGNKGTFNSESSDIRFSRSAKDIIDNLSKNLGNISISSVKDKTDYKKTDWLGIGLSALGRRQLTEIYGKVLPQLNKYNELAAQMDADKNDAGAEADSIVREWANLKDEDQLAGLMHDSTLAKIDPTKPYVSGDSISKYKQLRDAYNSLSPEAQAMYLKARDAYKKHYAKVHQAIKERILRSELSNQKKADLLKQMDNQFFGYTKGVYFPLARFGKYVVVMRNQNGDVESVSRAETMGEAQALRSELIQKFPHYKVNKVKLDKEYNKSRDAVGRGFMTSLFAEVDNLGLSTAERTEFEDTLSQLYLSSMPDLSWAKHGIHRKGTAGFSQDARRAFAQNMFSGANYLAKLRYGDQLAQQLDDMQKYADEQFEVDEDYDQRSAQSVITEMNKRHDNLMNPKGHPLSSALTSMGFIYYLGLSPAAAMVNLSQTALVAYPLMGAKWDFDKAGKELLKASNDFRKGVEFHKVKWQGTKTDLYKAVSSDISKFLNKDEQAAYQKAVDSGVIDVTQAHDLAGIAQGEDSGVMWKTRPIMRAASVMFHSAERFNREVTFIASYRLARQAGANHDDAYKQADKMTYDSHYDYGSGNRPRIMQGNVAKVLLLFKQFGQNMVYTLARQTYQSIKGETKEERREARRAISAILAMHATFAGALGLPMVGMLLSVASWMGGDDDDPWDAEVALRNYLAEAFNPTISNMLMKGAPRGIGVDISGRVGINNLLLPDVQEGLEGKKWWDSASAAVLGPIGGIGANIAKGAQEISEGHNLRGVESMLPVFLKNFAKTYRYADEGVQDKTGVSIMDEVSSMDLLVQGMGFSPSDVRTANEGKTAIYQLNRKLNERRSRLMTLWSRAKMMDDQQEMDEIWEEIQGFNDKNPSRRITRMNLNQSYRNRQRRIDRAEDGIYLSRNRQDAREAGYFAFGE